MQGVVLYPKDTEKWKQFTTITSILSLHVVLFCIPKILKNESNSQRTINFNNFTFRCFVSQRYWKMKAIHNQFAVFRSLLVVVLYPKDTEKWKQFTTMAWLSPIIITLFCIPKILKNESNSQRNSVISVFYRCCFVSQRYWKMKAIHNLHHQLISQSIVVLYPKDTEKWKQFTTPEPDALFLKKLFCIPKILKNESNSQHGIVKHIVYRCCFVSQRYWKMKAIHNS